MANLKAAHALIIHGTQVLVVRARGKSTLQPPGGKVKPGESGPDCVRREVLEETGLDVSGMVPIRKHAPEEWGTTHGSELFVYKYTAYKPRASPGNEIEE